MEFKLFVSNVPYNCSEEEFKNLMVSNDGLKDAKLVMRANTQINKGFGFVTALSQEKAEFYINESNVIINGRKLKFVKYANQLKFYKLHVMNIPEGMTEQEIYDIFSKFGSVDSVKRDFNRTLQKYTGTAVVVYNNYEDFNTVLTMKEIVVSDKVNVTVTKRHINRRKFINRVIEHKPVGKLHIQRRN